MTDPTLTTYRVQQRCTLRSEPKPNAHHLGRLDPTLDNGEPRLIKCRPSLPGWVEVVEGDITLGFVKAGALRPLRGQTV